MNVVEELAKIIDPRPWAHPMSWPHSWEEADVKYHKLQATRRAEMIIEFLRKNHLIREGEG